MKKLKLNSSAVLGAVLLLSAVFLSGCTSDNDFEKGKKQLETQGYTDVRNTGYNMFCCSDDDDFSTGFTAKDKQGNIVKGCFCSAIGKGITIRFE
jgi:hypothetical protein